MSESAELEREAEAARARLSDTAEQLRGRMSPGQMMDEVVNQFRNGDGGAMVNNLKSQVRDNPMALALIGSGLAWLMMGSGRDTFWKPASRTSSLDHSDNFAADYKSEASTHIGFPGDGTTAGYTDDGSREGRGIASGVTGAIALARNAVGNGLESASEAATRLTHDAQAAGHEALGRVHHTTSDFGQQARAGFLNVLEREPLIIGAIGVAVGAAIGALLPGTELERRNLGPAGETLKHRAEELVDRGMSVVKETASEVYQTAREEAKRQDLTPGDEPIAAKVGAVVRAATDKAGEMTKVQNENTPARTRDDIQPI